MKPFLFYLFTIIPIFFFSCGVILDDTTKLEGTWNFTQAEFYTYNPMLDSFKTYLGTNSSTLGFNTAYNGAFFCSTSDRIYTMTFERSENEWSRFSIIDGSDDYLVDKNRCNWKINSWDNTLELKISEATADNNFWKNGFTLKNYWPLTTNTTMELYIKASDVGLDYFSIDLSTDTIRAYSMKGFFTKQ